MGKTTITIPLVTLRPDAAGANFRPRYIPGKKHRKLGLKGQDLKHADGRWFSLEECLAWSAAQELRVAELERAAPRARRQLVRGNAGITVAELFERWWATPRMKGVRVVEGKKEREPLAANTVDFYKAGAKRLEELDDGLVWFSPANAVTAEMLTHPERGVLHRIEVARGLNVARCVRATGSSAWGWAKSKGLVDANPFKGLDYDMPVPAPRIRVGSIAEMQQLVKAADFLGRPEIGDSIVLGLWTGQRQSDRLALVDGQETSDGFVFRQQKKHGQPLLIPPSPELRVRLAAMRARRHDWRVNYPHIILNEEARAPFLKDWYKHLFARIRDAAAKGIPGETSGRPGPERDNPTWLLEPMPSLAGFHDQDLRDTAVTWLALAGCSKPEIASITGHSLKTIDEVLKHYLGMHPELARSAIAKLVTWFEQQGETNG